MSITKIEPKISSKILPNISKPSRIPKNYEYIEKSSTIQEEMNEIFKNHPNKKNNNKSEFCLDTYM